MLWWKLMFNMLKGVLGIARYSKDTNGNITGFIDADGNPVVPIDVTLVEFLALGPGDVADKAVVHITDLHTTSGVGGVFATWDGVAVKWGQNFGAAWVFDTYDLLLASFPLVSKWHGFRFWVNAGCGLGGAELIHKTTRYRHAQKGRVLMACKNNSDVISYSGNGSITGTLLTITGTVSGTLTLNSVITGPGVTSGTRVTDLGTWNGTTGVLTVSISHAGTGAIAITADKTIEKTELQWAIPTNFLRQYDKIVVEQHIMKTGTTAGNFLARDIHIGPLGTIADPSMYFIGATDVRATSSNTSIGTDEQRIFIVEGATSVRRHGPAGSFDFNGFNGTSRDAAQNISNISGALIVSLGCWINGATTDFATFQSGAIYLEMGGD